MVVESAAVVPLRNVRVTSRTVFVFFARAHPSVFAPVRGEQAFIRFLCIGFFVIAAFLFPPPQSNVVVCIDPTEQ